MLVFSKVSLIPAFHLNKDYQPGNVPYGSYLGLGGSIYGPGTTYRGTGLSPGYLNPGYRGYPVGGPGGIIGGGHIGWDSQFTNLLHGVISQERK